MLDFKELRVLTIGVYGFSEETFFSALKNAKVDLLCDIRMRRGMRGSKYKFANSNYLQNALRNVGIRYAHLKDLAPTEEIRRVQWIDDKESGTDKKGRTILGEKFIESYRKCCLSTFDTDAFVRIVAKDAHAICFLCVEMQPAACHRSLVSNRVAKDLSIFEEHLVP